MAFIISLGNVGVANKEELTPSPDDAVTPIFIIFMLIFRVLLEFGFNKCPLGLDYTISFGF